MGLLDSLFSSGSSGGGLLDFLRNNAANQPMPGMLPSDTAQYAQAGAPQAPQYAPVTPQQNAQPSPLDRAQYPFGPIGAPSQANAQMPPQQPPPVIPAQPMQAAPQGPGFGDRLMAGFQGLAAPSTGGLLGHLAGAVGGLAGQPTAANLTAQALIAKGVDPVAVKAAVGNPELMKTLITQTYGPQNIENLGSGYIRDPRTGQITRAYTPEKTPMSIGNGYIYDPATKKVTRAYTPDEKTPQGFTQDDNGNLHFMPGGPADPAYQRLLAAQKNDPNAVHVLGKGGELYKLDEKGNPTIVHKNESDADASLDDATTKAMAAQYLAGDKSVMQNLGRGAQGSANIVKLRTEIYKQAGDAGLDGKAIVNNFNEQAGNLAGQRSIGTRSANISLAANEANNMIPIALEASAKVPRGEWMPWNKMVQAYQTGTSSPELARFVAATNSLVNSYVRAVSPSGVPTDSMREHAYSMLNSAQSPKAYEAVTSIMQDEMKAAMQAPGQVRKELRHDDTPSAETKGAAPKPGSYVWSPDKGISPK